MKKIKTCVLLGLLLLICILFGCSHGSGTGSLNNNGETINITMDNVNEYFITDFSYSNVSTGHDTIGIPIATAILNVSISPRTQINNAENATIQIGIGGGKWETSDGHVLKDIHLNSDGHYSASINVRCNLYAEDKEALLSSETCISDASGSIVLK